MNFPKRFHVIGLCHTISNEDFMACAYTQKIRKICKMLKETKGVNHQVIHYGVEGADVQCDEHVSILTKEELYKEKGYGIEGWKSKPFSFSKTDASAVKFNEVGKNELSARTFPGDFILLFFGKSHEVMVSGALESNDVFVVEAGIGYDGVFVEHCVFESNSMMAWVLGRNMSQFPSPNVSIIPNYFDPDDFPEASEGSDEKYWLYLGRKIVGKGLDIAIQACVMTGQKMIISGQGDHGYDLSKYNNIEERGCVGIVERKELYAGAQGVILQSRYAEPFGGVAVEAMLSGVPVITSRRGAFTEYMQDGVNGYIAEDLSAVIRAMHLSYSLDRASIRKHAIEKFSIDAIRERYESYFNRIFYNRFFRGNFIPSPFLGVKYDCAFFGSVPFTYSPTIGAQLAVTRMPVLVTEQSLFPGVDNLLCQEVFTIPRILDYIPCDMVLDAKEVTVDRGVAIPYKNISQALSIGATATTLVSNYSEEIVQHLVSLLQPKVIRWVSFNANTKPIKLKGFKVSFTNKNDDATYYTYVEGEDVDEGINLNISDEDIRLNVPDDGISLNFPDEDDVPEEGSAEVEKSASSNLKIDDDVKREKVAYWTRKEWAFGRIMQAIQKYSRYEVVYYDWADTDQNNILFIRGKWKQYKAILGNSELTDMPIRKGWIKKADMALYLSLIRPTVHAPLTTNKYYVENLTENCNIVSGINVSIAKSIKVKYGHAKVYYTPTGYDPELFNVQAIKNYSKHPFTVGFIGELNHSEEVEKVKQSRAFARIAKKAGVCTKYIHGHDLSVSAKMYEDVDLMICTSKYEGGPLGVIEAMACGVPAISTPVGLMVDLDIMKFRDIETAVGYVQMLSGNKESYEDYRQHCIDKVSVLSWKKSIKSWDGFIGDDFREGTPPPSPLSPIIPFMLPPTSRSQRSSATDDHTPTPDEPRRIMNDKAIKTFAHMMKKPTKLVDGTMYDPLEHQEEAGNYKPGNM